MDYLIICAVALLVSGLTLFSGFGLGTLLMPAFALFFPLDIAVAQTAVVHLANNLFKLALLGRHAERSVVLKFGVPAVICAFIGAYLMTSLVDFDPIFEYRMMGELRSVNPLAFVIAILMIAFAILEGVPRFAKLSFDPRYLPLGGILSGFFGGLSGHQGALRSAFLIKAGLKKETFIGTGIVISVLVDLVRLAVYGTHFRLTTPEQPGLIVAPMLSAFAGALLGRQLLHKVTLRTVQLLVSFMLIIIALGLGTGII